MKNIIIFKKYYSYQQILRLGTNISGIVERLWKWRHLLSKFDTSQTDSYIATIYANSCTRAIKTCETTTMITANIHRHLTKIVNLNSLERQ